MKLASPTAESAQRLQQDRLKRDRAAAQPIRSLYPKVATLGLQLHFEGTDAQVPADQLHVMHPPARAFFEFACPYAGCNGHFNLSDAVGTALKSSVKSTVGVLECPGLRAKDQSGRQPCGLRLHYTITPEYSRA